VFSVPRTKDADFSLVETALSTEVLNVPESELLPLAPGARELPVLRLARVSLGFGRGRFGFGAMSLSPFGGPPVESDETAQ
jgi:hypothetical protein